MLQDCCKANILFLECLSETNMSMMRASFLQLFLLTTILLVYQPWSIHAANGDRSNNDDFDRISLDLWSQQDMDSYYLEFRSYRDDRYNLVYDDDYDQENATRPLGVHVRENVVVESFLEDFFAIPLAQGANLRLTMEDFFQVIMDRNGTAAVTYDATYWFPRRLETPTFAMEIVHFLPLDTLQEQYQQALHLWNSQGLDAPNASYEMDYYGRGSNDWLAVTVERGFSIANVVPPSDSSSNTIWPVQVIFLQLSYYLWDAPLVRATLEYDDQRGYPTLVDLETMDDNDSDTVQIQIRTLVPASQERQEFLAARQLWQTSNIFDYNYYYYTESNVDPWIVMIQASHTILAVLDIFGFAVEETSFPGGIVYTVDQLFDILNHALASPNQTIATAEYDQTYGFPTAIEIQDNNTDSVLFYQVEGLIPYSILRRQLYSQWYDVWQANDIANYSYTLQVVCFCEESTTIPTTIQVRNKNDVVAVLPPTTNPHAALLTMDDVFAQILVARLEERPMVYNVQYNDTFGHPTRLLVDSVPGLADEELKYVISDLIVLDNVMAENEDWKEHALLDLETNRSLWESQFPTNPGTQSYEYIFQQACFCVPEILVPMKVTVLNGLIESVVDPVSLDPIDPLAVQEAHILTVEDVFEQLEAFLTSDGTTNDPTLFAVTYDVLLGYPSTVFLGNDQVPDAQEQYWISNVSLLNSNAPSQSPSAAVTTPEGLPIISTQSPTSSSTASILLWKAIACTWVALALFAVL